LSTIQNFLKHSYLRFVRNFGSLLSICDKACRGNFNTSGQSVILMIKVVLLRRCFCLVHSTIKENNKRFFKSRKSQGYILYIFSTHVQTKYSIRREI